MMSKILSNQNQTKVFQLSELVKNASLSLFFGSKRIDLESLIFYRKILQSHAKRYQTRCKVLNILGAQVFTVNLVSFLVLVMFQLDPVRVNSAITIIHDFTVIGLGIFKHKLCNCLRTKSWMRNRAIETGLLILRGNSVFSLIMEDMETSNSSQPLSNSTISEVYDKKEQIKDRYHFSYPVLYVVNIIWMGYHAATLYCIQKMILMLNLMKKTKRIFKDLTKVQTDTKKIRRYAQYRQNLKNSLFCSESSWMPWNPRILMAIKALSCLVQIASVRRSLFSN
uniref:Uncharacterized protein n=1 Tax=Tetranychus urticae TaxID=32264 RepID=T1JVK2_TETUR